MRARRTSSLVLVTIAVAIATLTSSGAVADSVDVGSTPALPGQLVPCGPGTTYFQDGTAANTPGYTTPAGVVTSFSVLALPTNPGSVALRTAREGPNDTYTITGASEAHQLVGGRLNSFLTRVPVKSGDVLGVHIPKENVVSPGCNFTTGLTGDGIRFRNGTAFDDPVGSVVPTDGSITARINLSARVEPDADGDGYGDLTQDACPALKNSHDDCTPPNTFLKSGPSKKVVTGGNKAKVKISFFASEPATFTCQLDKATAKPCASPYKAKVQPGKHKVSITATDQVGNVDASPLVVRFKVVRDQA
jgi:hypothetical protein